MPGSNQENMDQEDRDHEARIQALCQEQERLKAIEREQECCLKELAATRIRMEANLAAKQSKVDRYDTTTPQSIRVLRNLQHLQKTTHIYYGLKTCLIVSNEHM